MIYNVHFISVGGFKNQGFLLFGSSIQNVFNVLPLYTVISKVPLDKKRQTEFWLWLSVITARIIINGNVHYSRYNYKYVLLLLHLALCPLEMILFLFPSQVRYLGSGIGLF